MKFKKIKTKFLKKSHWDAAPFVISISSLLFTMWWSYKLLPLQQANIIMSTPTVMVTDSQNNKKRVSLELSLKNIGKSSAKETEFTIYGLSLDKKDDYILENKNPIFTNRIINDMDPEVPQTFGSIYFEAPSDTFLDEPPPNIALIIHLIYEDSLKAGKVQHKWLWYKYTIGSPTIYSLLADGELNDERKQSLKIILGEYSNKLDEKTY